MREGYSLERARAFVAPVCQKQTFEFVAAKVSFPPTAVEFRLANNVSEGRKTADSDNSCRVAMGQTFPCFQLLLPAR